MARLTKDKIIEAASNLICLRGFNNTGIEEILKVSEVSKGSFYHYFKSTEELGLAVIDRVYDIYKTNILEIGDGLSEKTPIERLFIIFDRHVEYIRSKDC